MLDAQCVIPKLLCRAIKNSIAIGSYKEELSGRQFRYANKP